MVTLRPVSSTAASLDEELQALAAPVGDPLWMLARQCQTGAFIADDAGTPVHVRVSHLSAPFLLAGQALTGPLEPVVEAEPPPAPSGLDTATRVRLATELFRRVRDAGASAESTARLRAALAAAYSLHPAADDSRQTSFAGRLPDAAQLFVELANVLAADGSGPLPELPGLDRSDPATAAAVETAMRGWFAWMHPQLNPAGTGSTAPAAWDGERLEYTFEASTELADGPVTLLANGYDGTGADWYSFDRTVLPPAGADGSPAQVEVRPAPVTYAGMPRPRFWEMEDGDVNLDAMAGADPAHALLRTFAHAYANDWYLVPLEVPPGASLIANLDVTDTFGSTTTIAATAALDGPSSSWALWEISAEPTGTDPGRDAAAGLRIYLPCSPPPLQSAALEDVLVARDEMANLAWVIELTTRDQDGAAIDRNRRWLALRPASDPSFDPATRYDAADYRLGTTLPDYWYPLIAAAGPLGRPLLELAELPDGATDVPDTGVQGQLMPHTPGTSLADEEASRTGNRVTRQDRLMRTTNGPVVWRARARRPGVGEASSGLQFDILR
jgi:hypothetical protein